VKTASPLRYPGGKSAMSGLLAGIRKLNQFGDRAIAEPFAGGAGASLSLLYLEESPQIHINDVDPAIFDFWWTLVHRPKAFLNLLASKRASISEWRRQRDIYRDSKRMSKLRRGFAAFYLNRCNRSGIIMNGGPIGGISQEGKWKISARFNKVELNRRCEKIAEYRSRISVSCKDGLQFIESLSPDSTFFFIDPPYFEKGPTLYLNALDRTYHSGLAEKLHSMSDKSWVLTYDDCPDVRRLYRGWAAIRPFNLRYSASRRRAGNEILITPKWMRLPKAQDSDAIQW